MKRYEHTQPGTVILYAMGVSFVIGAVLSVVVRPAILSVILVAVVGWMFRSLTIEISDTELEWFFGSGFPRGRAALSDIESAEAIRISWMNGWGIHYTLRGWLYNVSGYGAVAVRLKNGKRFCLGTDEPEELARQLTMSA